MNLRNWSVLAIALGARFVVGQGIGTYDLIDVNHVRDQGYIQSWACTVGIVTDQNGATFNLTTSQKWGGFGRRLLTSWDWSNYDSIIFVLKNNESRPITIAIRVEGTTDQNDGSKIESGGVTVPAGAQTPIVYDLRPDRIAAQGLKGLPPVMDSFHRRLYPIRNLDMTKIYGWWIYTRDDGTDRFTVSQIKLVKRPSSYPGVFDSYGQYITGEWPGKVHNDTELATQRDAEATDLANNPGPGSYDGTNIFPKQSATGKWRTYKTPSGKWYFVHPNGKLFWSLGMSLVSAVNQTLTQGRESLFSSLPPNSGSTAQFWNVDPKNRTVFDFGEYNLYRKFGSTWAVDFVNRSLSRLKSWGFNTVGPWSDDTVYAKSDLPYTTKVATTLFPTRLKTPWAYWSSLPDAMAPDFQSWMSTQFAKDLAPYVGKTNFMGVFVDGELSWGLMDTPVTRYQIAIGALNAPSTQPAKAQFMSQLQNKYATIALLNVAWATAYTSWNDLLPEDNFKLGTLTQACQDDMKTFVTSFATAYFTKVKAALAAAGNTSLYLGGRECWATPEVIAACMPYVDVYSITLYADAPQVDWTFPGITKPVYIAEFSYGAVDRGGFHPGAINAHDQNDRANRTKAYITSALKSKPCIGVAWFHYYDEPTSGRPQDGENYNLGYLSVSDTPFPELVAASRAMGKTMYWTRGP